MNSIELFKTFVTEGITVGEGVPAGPLTLFPLSHQFPASDYLLYQDAHARGLVRIEETSEAGTVGELKVTTQGGQPVLLLEGEVLLGMKQTRVLNATILVAGRAVLTVPVSCVEVGRWRRVSEAATGRDQINLSPRVRGSKTASVMRSARLTGRYVSDQGAVWDGVAEVLSEHKVGAPTGSYAEIARARATEILISIRDIRPAVDQSGVIAYLGTRPICLDVFDSPAVLAAVWDGLIGSYAADVESTALLKPKRTATKPASAIATRWLKGVAEGDIVSSPSVGLGSSVTSIAPRVEAAGLIYEGRLVHLAAFPTKGKMTRTSFISPGLRRN